MLRKLTNYYIFKWENITRLMNRRLDLTSSISCMRRPPRIRIETARWSNLNIARPFGRELRLQAVRSHTNNNLWMGNKGFSVKQIKKSCPYAKWKQRMKKLKDLKRSPHYTYLPQGENRECKQSKYANTSTRTQLKWWHKCLVVLARLPKLSFLKFRGDVTQWNTIWD